MTISRFNNYQGNANVVALRIPVFGSNAFSIAPFIFLHKKTAAKLDPYKYRLMLDHEMVYIHAQRMIGRRKYFWQYAVNSTFRYLVEIRAYAEDLLFLLYTCGRDHDEAIQEIADILASKEYGNMVTVDHAKKCLPIVSKVVLCERIIGKMEILNGNE